MRGQTTMASDLYTILGVPRGASADEIRKAYRKLAKDLHPDLRPGDRAAEEEFKRVSAAFAILGDADKRGRYDRGEIDERGQEKGFAGGFGGFGGRAGRPRAGSEDFSDIFRDLFGQSRFDTGGFGMRGSDVRYTLEVDFLEAVRGVRKRISLPDGRLLDLTIPEGVEEGQVLRLKGRGGEGVGGGEAGDALVEVKIKPHPVFRREGDTIALDLPISLAEAVSGGRVELATPSGRVAIVIPKGSTSGRQLRLKGKGVKNRTGGAGDLLIRLQVSLPDVVDPELEALIQDWQAKHPYNPRAKLPQDA